MKNTHKFNIISGYENIDLSGWRELLHKCDNTSVFQSPQMFRFFEGLNGFSPFVFATNDQQGNILALISGIIQKEGSGVKGQLTKRAVIFGGPLLSVSEQTEEALILLLKELNTYLSKKAIYVETRNLNDYSIFKKAFKKAGWEYKPHLNFQVDCSNKETIVKRISKSKMRQIRKSIKTGAEIVESNDLREIKAFYDILENLYKTKVKTPLPTFEFFRKFYESDLGKYLLIRFENRIVGGIVCPILPGKVIYEWYVCGLDGEIKDVYPSILATWAAIDYAVNNNIHRFDFMGAGAPDKDYGVREFKSKFGGELVEYGRFYNIYKPLLYQVGKTGVKIMKTIK